MIRTGIDISKWNDTEDVEEYIEAHELDFAIIRAGYGRCTRDKLFNKHRDTMYKHNIPFGVYWFSYATTVEEAREEARCCWYNTVLLGTRLEYPIYFDLEYDSQAYYKNKTGKGMTKKYVLELTDAFCSEIERLGGYAGYYCNKDFYRRYYKNLTKYTCWLADYKRKDFKGIPSHIHMVQTHCTPLDQDICKVDFPSIIKRNKLNGW